MVCAPLEGRVRGMRGMKLVLDICASERVGVAKEVVRPYDLRLAQSQHISSGPTDTRCSLKY